MTLQFVVGYDPREWEAFLVTCDSIRRRSSEPVEIYKLDERELRARQLYTRPYHVDPAGQFWDDRDGRPFSVAFSFTRFLVPFLDIPTGPVCFVDCDFVFMDDPVLLFKEHDWGKALKVVKHKHEPPGDTMKMDRVSQGRYLRKNWSSCMLWNTKHPAHRQLTATDVNTRTGSWLHAFGWLQDNDIGTLPERWNWLAGISPTTGGGVPEKLGAIHYTEGGPWFDHMQDCPFADEWRAARDAMNNPVSVNTSAERVKRPYTRRKAA